MVRGLENMMSGKRFKELNLFTPGKQMERREVIRALQCIQASADSNQEFADSKQELDWHQVGFRVNGIPAITVESSSIALCNHHWKLRTDKQQHQHSLFANL